MDEEKLGILRHSAAHVLASAISKKYPKAKRTIGPSIENGFYYDFDDLDASQENFPDIEKIMKEEVDAKLPFEQREVSVAEAKKMFKDNPYKLELIDEFAKDSKKLTVVQHGDFIDLCRGGHVHDTGEIRAFKLLNVAGAYWRGDANNKMLTRIYGTAWPDRKQLKVYLHNLAEAEKRDHRKVAKKLGLWVYSDLVGPGLPLYTPKGTVLRKELQNYVQEVQGRYGFEEVIIPGITKKDLYIKSGHWDKFGDDLFKVTNVKGSEEYALKPMNCPHHHMIFNSETRSYRDLPIRFADFTMLYRNENPGQVGHSMTRVRAFSQDDSHIYCTMDQVEQEVIKCMEIQKEIFNTLGLTDFTFRLSTWDPKEKEKYLGDPKQWKKATDIFTNLLDKQGIKYDVEAGEAAFYGPKIDFLVKDAIGRKHQLSTIQLDILVPSRFDLAYVDDNGEKVTPIVIHFAKLGSLERFLAVYLEHTAGNLPLWLAPVQVKVLSFTDRSKDYCQGIVDKLKAEGVRAELDASDQTVNAKVRDAEVVRTPYILVCGDKEEEAGTVAVRTRGEKRIGYGTKLDDFISKVKKEIQTRSL